MLPKIHDGTQKQPPKVFYEKTILENFAIFTPTVLESFLNKVAGLQAFNLMKKRLQFSCKYCEIFRNTYFGKHLRAAASGESLRK